MKGSDYEAIGWIMIILSLIVFFIGMMDNVDEFGGSSCCCGLIGLIIAQTGYTKKKKEERLRLQTVYVQPNPVVVQQPIYVPTPVPAPAPPPAPAPLPVPDPPRKLPEQHWGSEQWGEKARNLELARDWEGAAQAYQKAGLYAEAGRVREAHLEKGKDEDKVVVNIDRIGDNVLHDSVMYNEDDTENQIN
jgi:hypothetical protein